MRRVSLSIVLLVGVLGCSSAAAPVDMEAQLYNDNWITPAAVEIGNFFPGAQAEWSIRLHNGNDASVQSQSFTVTTEPGETAGPIALACPLAGGAIEQVLSITSSDTTDILLPTAYLPETKELMVAGFAPDTSRIITILYEAWTEFSVYYRYPNRVREGFSYPTEEVETWVTVADASPVLAPKETRAVLIVVAMPEDAAPPAEEWEFWIAVLEEGQGAVQTEMCSRWFVTMCAK